MKDNGTNPLVSAVITAHNRKDLVQNAIESVQKQTYQNMEIIVVDDASLDGTPELLEPLSRAGQFQYIYIPKEESKGGNHARNVGILAARGKYIAFLDDDDEWLPEKTEKQIAILEEHPECGVCHCGKIYDYDLGKRQKFQDLSGLAVGNLSKEIYTHVCCVTSAMMAEKELLIEVGLFDEQLRYWQEYELCMRLFQKTQLAVVREHLLLYRIVQSDMGRLTNNVDGWEDAVEYIYNKHKEEMSILSLIDVNRRDAFHFSDGASRCFRSGDFKKQKMYLWKLVRVTHSPVEFAKAILKIFVVDNYINVKNRIMVIAKKCMCVCGGGN